MPSATVEDYIKHIYLIAQQSESPNAPMGQLADAVNVVPGTATTEIYTILFVGSVRCV